MTEIKHEYHRWIVYINGNPKFSFIYREEAEAVAEVIDALVDAHGTLESLTYSGADKFVVEEELKNIEQALKKAGCGE